jgi:hypothetical protein
LAINAARKYRAIKGSASKSIDIGSLTGVANAATTAERKTANLQPLRIVDELMAPK